jgi:iron complex transport system substrate-binding protein
MLVNNLTDQRRVERLREAGIVVFELGPMRGLGTLLDDITTVAALLGEEDRGRTLAKATQARMNAIASGLPHAGRKTAIYVGMHGTQFYGGTRGTSYHDVLLYAGLIDCAAEHYEDWPAYSAEDLLALDPDVIVTVRGQRSALCAHAALHALRACGPSGKVVELDERLLMDPGLAMLDASMAVREAVYGAAPGPAP